MTHFYAQIGKRIVDILVGFCILIISAPALLAISVGVKIKLGSPIFFSQRRPGFKGKAFIIYKFRTMTDIQRPSGELMPDADRLTPFGSWLRKTSLDELPEIWNVIKGNMSLVGPRPLLMEYLQRYSAEQMLRHDVKPGVTGWAQINGRNALTWERKFELDIWYVNHISLFLDLKILLITIWKILKREGINQLGKATADEFKGG